MDTKSSHELWRPLVGYEDYYEVSDLGRVRSIASGQGRRTGRILKAHLTAFGYLQLDLQVNGKRKGPLVHTLVANTFLGPCPEGLEVDHADGNKTNNNLLNLRYVTRSANMLLRNDRRRNLGLPLTGLQHGEHNPKATLTSEKVLEIRRLYKEGLLQRQIAEMFDVDRGTVGKIIRGDRWKHV